MFKGGMASMIQKAQKIQEDMQKAQAEIKNLTAIGKADGGTVQVTINGEHQAINLQIDESVMDDKDMLEDLILTAINDASKQISDASAAKMQSTTGGIKLPGGMNLPF
ncbi:MAG: YbaB/EbfC family nucleoid-associated protein [Candidatus Thioglobus sp.]|nr:MAG: YbaB/EbfC family nucleoid-associated protein [Candidatus Thioglobus sp.]